MEHEVYVPFPAGAVRSVLADPQRLARCVPGLHPEAWEEPPEGQAVLNGRLRVRAGGSTITYRGTAWLVPEGGGDGGCTVRGEGTEARGGGSVRLVLTIAVRPADDGAGTVLACRAEVSGGGRLAGIEPQRRESAGRRLLERVGSGMADALSTGAPGRPGTGGAPKAPGGIGGPDDNEPVIPNIPAPEPPEPPGPAQGEAEPDTGRQGGSGAEGAGGAGSGTGAGEGAGEPPPGADGVSDVAPQPAEAEAAQARRAMIGRSAEEVDHAPPRGRYTPVPPPVPVLSAAAALRWAASVTALVAVAAVVVTRVLRRRR